MRLIQVFCGVILLNSIYCAASADETEYLAVLINGRKVGHAVTQRIVKDSHISTSEKMKITITRMGMEMSISTVETYIETLDGKPVGFESSQDLSGMVSSIKGTIADGKVEAVIQAV